MHAFASGPLRPGQPEALYRADVVAKSLAVERAVVEVVVADPMAPNVDAFTPTRIIALRVVV